MILLEGVGLGWSGRVDPAGPLATLPTAVDRAGPPDAGDAASSTAREPILTHHPDPCQTVRMTLPEHRIVCPCGREVDRFVLGQGRWHAVWAAGLAPLITVAIYLLVVAVGIQLLLDGEDLVGGLVLALVPLVYVLTLLVVASRHRGGCLVRRSLYWFVAWPGYAVAALASF